MKRISEHGWLFHWLWCCGFHVEIGLEIELLFDVTPYWQKPYRQSKDTVWNKKKYSESRSYFAFITSQQLIATDIQAQQRGFIHSGVPQWTGWTSENFIFLNVTSNYYSFIASNSHWGPNMKKKKDKKSKNLYNFNEGS